MGLPRQVEAARVMVEAAEEAARKQKEGGSDHQNPIIEPVSPESATVATVTPIDGDEIVLDWEKEFNVLSGEHGKLERRFQVLQGKYNSEVPLLHKEIASLKATGALPDGGSPDTTVVTPPGEDPNANVKQLYGEDLVNFIVGKSAESQGKIDALEAKVSSFDVDQQDNAVENFFDAIEKAHPGWTAINRTSAWIGYLKQMIPELGIARQQIIDKAQDEGNPQPIIDQLTAFKAHIKTGNPKNSQVVPVDGGSPTPKEASTRFYNESEVSLFYKNAADKAGKGRPVSDTDEYKRLDAEYSKAAREGRIVVGQ
jgi:hypothetical protein